ncbi:MAG: hypothetical protein HZC51_07830 [Nitrospirae bacterium]|nr:hypothetical protein [Nitrospirota bacterium]
MTMKLTDEETKLLSRLENMYIKKPHYVLVVIVIFILLALFSEFYIGGERGRFYAIIDGVVAITAIINYKSYRKLFNIIMKLKD